MSRSKTTKFEEITRFPNLVTGIGWPKAKLINHLEEELHIKGKWKSDFWKNEQKVVLELACGHADYSRAMAKMYPDVNFIAADLKGHRLWTAATLAQKAEISNLFLFHTHIESIEHFMGKGDVDEIWITFPDPHPKRKGTKNRLTAPKFIKAYQNILSPKGIIHLKTDSDLFYEYTLEVIGKMKLTILENFENLYEVNPIDPIYHIKTRYEKMHLEEGRTIKYLAFQF